MLTAFLLLVATTLIPAPAPAAAPTAFDVSIYIQPSSMDHYQLLRRKTPNTFTCGADVYAPQPEGVSGHVELVLLPGQSDKVTKVFGPYSMDFSVRLQNNRAHAEVTVKRGDQIVSRQRSTVFIRTDEGIVPLR
jgi:hypothetical protein